MRGYLRSATVIEACDRCYALRDTKSEPGECKSCRALLNISFNKVHMLSFGDVSSDIVPRALTFPTTMQEGAA